MKHQALGISPKGVRPAIFVALCCLASPVSAQTSVPVDVHAAIRTMAYSPTLKLTISGTETVDGRGKAFRVEASFLVAATSAGDTVGLVEILETQNGALVQRTVGDGQTLWVYDAKKNEYLPLSYGNMGNDPSNYYGRLSDGLGGYVSGYGTYAVRFLRDLLHRRDSMGPAGAMFRSWTPGFQPTYVTQGQPPVADPVNPRRRYVADPNRYFILYQNGSKPNKSVAFEFEDDGSQYRLTYAYMSESTELGSRSRFLDWQCAFATDGLVFAPETFRFVPPAKSRALPAPKLDG